jgi:hypothetical protein
MNSTLYPHSRSEFRPASTLKVGGVIVGAALIAAGVVGCGRRPIVVQAPPATVIQQPAPAQIVTTAPVATPPVLVLKEAPPPPRYEPMTPQPASDHVWIPGYWAWQNGQRLWMAGHWEIPPHTGARWVSPRWERQGDGYVFVQGYWQ